jgi:beta-mannosidase
MASKLLPAVERDGLVTSSQLNNLRIPDPFKGFNELECEWVGEKAWSYRLQLPQVPPASDGAVHVLAFDGLDTFAEVKLNGETLSSTDNMFIPVRVDITSKLKQDAENILQIDFDCAMFRARAIKDAHPEHKFVGFNCDMARLAIRKAQYHW